LLYFGTEHYKTIPLAGQSEMNPKPGTARLNFLVAVRVQRLRRPEPGYPPTPLPELPTGQQNRAGFYRGQYPLSNRRLFHHAESEPKALAKARRR